MASRLPKRASLETAPATSISRQAMAPSMARTWARVSLSYGLGRRRATASRLQANMRLAIGPLNNGDTDLGSSGPLLAAGGRLVGGGKQGKLYVLNSQTMQPSQNGPSPGPVPTGGSDGFEAFINAWHDDSSQRTCMIGAITRSQCFMPHPRYEETELAGPNIHSGPIYWNGKVYSMPEKDFIRAFHYNVSSGILATTPAVRSTVRAPDGMPGAAIIASSDGTSDGVIWATIPKVDRQWQNVPKMLLAFDATTLNELWRDDDDDIAFAKFTPPTVVDGKVFPPDVRKQNDRLRTEVRADAGLVLRHSASLRKLYRPERRARRRNRRRNAVA